MLVFWSLAALLLAVTLALLLRPLLRARHVAAAPDADAAAISVYRDQKLALDAECADGVITAAERDAAVTELAQRLGDEVATVRSAQTDQRGQRRAWFAAAALLLLIPSAAVVLYTRLGNPAAGEPAQAAAMDGRNPHEIADTQIVAMVDSLAQRLKARPDDADGWVLLARSYQALGRFRKPPMLVHADALIADNAALLADYADVLAMAQGRKLAGKPAALASARWRSIRITAKHWRWRQRRRGGTRSRRRAGVLAASARRFPQASDDAKQVTAIIAEIESAQREGKGVPVASDSAPRREAPRARDAAGRCDVAGRVDISPARDQGRAYRYGVHFRPRRRRAACASRSA
jgi:cytochrome c-type biogenesis protein CcmH